MSPVMVPGAQSWSEWNVKLGNPPAVATCVEVSEMMVDHLVKAGFPLSDQEDIALAQDLINRGQASASGATDYLAASQQMVRLGIPNTPYGADWFAAHDFVPVCKAALDRGIPVLFGFSSAFLSHDDWSGNNYNTGVDGHGICLFGYDDTGAIVGDPNTPEALSGKFVHYQWANLKAAGGSWPSMVIPEGAMAITIAEVADYFTEADANTWVCKQNGHKIVLGLLGAYKSWPALGTLNGLTALGLPVGNEQYPKPGTAVQDFERGRLAYDPQHQLDTPPGFSGDCYLMHVLPVAAPAPDPALEAKAAKYDQIKAIADAA